MIVVIIYEEMPSQEIVATIEDIHNTIGMDAVFTRVALPEIYFIPFVVDEEKYEGYFYLNRIVEVVNTSAHLSLDS